MSFELDFLSMMPHTITMKPRIDFDIHGEPSYGPEVQYRCRITGKFIPLRSATMQSDTPIFDIYCGAKVDPDDPNNFISMTNEVIGVEDFIQLPNDPAWIDGTPEIFAIARETDDDGHHHVKIQCGWKYHRQGQ